MFGAKKSLQLRSSHKAFFYVPSRKRRKVSKRKGSSTSRTDTCSGLTVVSRLHRRILTAVLVRSSNHCKRVQ